MQIVAGPDERYGCYNPDVALLVSTKAQPGHDRIDARSLAMHKAIAEKLRVSPELIDVALDNLRRWVVGAGRSQPYLDAWGQLLSRPIDELLTLIVEDSETMRAMRQASPFAGVLSPKERWEIYDAFAIGARDPGSGNDRPGR